MNKKKWLAVYAAIGAVVILLNIIAWTSTAFCDAYIAYIFPIWVNTYGRLTGLVPFSVGELLLGLGVGLMAVALVLWIPWGLGKCGRGNSESEEHRARSRRFAGFCRGYYLFAAWVLLGVCLIMTLNCTILYHASTFSENYFEEADSEYTLEELIRVRNMVVEECNRLSQLMERDEQGRILYDGDMRKEAIRCMQTLGETYDRLDGWYPRPKPLMTSDFFSQQYICGYYFPFSMEANYNQVMYIMNLPAAMCHELSHLRGYIFEDEANFISYLACIQSEDPVFRYSGYLSVLNYLDNDFYDAVGRDAERYFAQPHVLAQVREDNMFLTREEWERINKAAVIDTETVDEVSDVLMDVTLKANGVQDGIISYDRVVELLLLYYDYHG